VGILERVECRIFASSTSCRARRDLGALEPRAGSEVCSRTGEGAGGDSGGGGGNIGKSDDPAEAKPGSIVVPISVEEFVKPYRVKKSSKGSTPGAPEYEGIRVFQLFVAGPMKVDSNAESTPLGISCTGNRPPIFELSRLEEPIGVLNSYPVGPSRGIFGRNK
jgi:hypothetical protein